MSDIYAIKNLVNNKMYIGSSKSAIRRKYFHFYQLKKGIHHSSHLQRAYDEYGKDMFSFYILEECEEPIRKERELFYIEKYNCFHRDYGYNVYEPNGDKFACSKETKAKLAVAHPLKIEIDLYKDDGTFIETFSSLNACARKYNLNCPSLCLILKGDRKSTQGYVIVKHGEPFNYIKSPKTRDMSRFVKR